MCELVWGELGTFVKKKGGRVVGGGKKACEKCRKSRKARFSLRKEQHVLMSWKERWGVGG